MKNPLAKIRRKCCWAVINPQGYVLDDTIRYYKANVLRLCELMGADWKTKKKHGWSVRRVVITGGSR